MLLAQITIALFILDDVGARDLAAANTPNIDALAASGVNFTRAYSQPWCAPTRDSLYHSRWAATAKGGICDPGVAEPAMQQLFVANGYDTVLIGKWHQGGTPFPAPWALAPNLQGFNHWYAGQPVIAGSSCSPPWPGDGWRIDDGVISFDGIHHTLRERDATPGDLTIYGFRDAHSPWEPVPGVPLPPNPTQRELYLAEIEGIDQAIGVILTSLPLDTWVIVLGDNGTPAAVDVDNLRGSKHDVYEGGVRVPMIFAGPGLTPRSSNAIVHVADILPTLCEALGWTTPAWVEGQSLIPALLGQPLAREWVAVQNLTPGFIADAVIEKRWKLVRNSGGEEFYKLPDETTTVLPFGPNYDRLKGIAESVFP